MLVKTTLLRVSKAKQGLEILTRKVHLTYQFLDIINHSSFRSLIFICVKVVQPFRNDIFGRASLHILVKSGTLFYESIRLLEDHVMTPYFIKN